MSRPAESPPGTWAPLAVAGTGILAVTPSCLWAAAHSHVSPTVHEAALFAHLACLVLGFGAVLLVDWTALLWVARRRRLAHVLATATTAQAPIWVGYTGLVLSGLLLEPDLTAPMTQLKLCLVVLIGWNGLLATWLHHRLRAGARPVAVAGAVACAALSQLGWWGATVIGFANAR